MKKNVIWSSTVESLWNEEKYIREHLEEFSLAKDAPSGDIEEVANENIWGWRDDEKENLDKMLDTEIVVIGTAGVWNGTRHHVANVGSQLNVVLDSPYRDCDETEVYADAYDIRWEGVHHDGRNNALFRRMKDNGKYEAFVEALANAKDEKARKRTISRYTSSLRPYVAEVYGW